MEWYMFLTFSKIYQSPFLLFLYKFYKYIYRLTTRTTELYRICDGAAKELAWVHDLDGLDTDTQLDQRQISGNNDDNDDGESNSDDNDEKVGEISDLIPLLQTQSRQQQTAKNTIAASSYCCFIPADVVFQVDRSILYSTQLDTERRQLESKDCLIDELTRSILVKKRFPGTLSSPQARVLRGCLLQIAATYQLTRDINERAHTKYDSTDNLHEQKLLKLWAYLMPETELESRLTRQWGEIGFQGNDPASDFRGMGMQGLDDLVYYTKTYPEYSQRTFLSSQHPISWYPFAIVGINISQFTIQILRTRQIQHFLFKYGINKETYQDLYCFLYHSFNEYWSSHENPRLTVMDFEQTFKTFKQIIHGQILTHDLMPLSVFLQKQQEEESALKNDDEAKDSTMDDQQGNTLHHRVHTSTITT